MYWKLLFSNKEKYNVVEQSTPFKLILLEMNLPASGR